jgi:molybdopterin synthase catalytic subunit
VERVVRCHLYTEKVDTPLLAIGAEPLALESLVAAVSARPDHTAGAAGAVASFLGLVRNHNLGRRVRYLEYEAYEPLARRAFERIAAEIEGRWPGVRLALHHRTGRLEVGEASVAIAAASVHRAHAFAACRYAIERVKQIAPIWKREYFEGGDVWIEGATADPEDARARAEAERAACA